MLAARIRSSVSSGKVQVSACPVASTREFLESHPLLYGLQVDPCLVHKQLLRLRDASAEAASNVVVSASNRTEEEEVCLHCRVGRPELDERNACHVCSSCGIVFSLRSVNVHGPDLHFDPEPHLTLHRNFGTVPRGISRRNWERSGMGSAAAVPLDELGRAVPRMPEHSGISLRELEHWNQYTHHSQDALLQMLQQSERAPAPPSVHRDVKLAAALLFPLLQPQLESLDSKVRSAASRCQPLPQLQDPTPAPDFACPRCLKRVHSAKHARFHCKSVGNKRPRV